jgi:ribosomal protein S27AE
MGRLYLFECEKCGYRVKVAGGAAEGLEFAVQTVLCHQCRELHDVVTSLKVPWPPAAGDASAGAKLKVKAKPAKAAPAFDAVVNRLPLTGRMRTRWRDFKPACPVSASHRIREWNQPDKCPRCGVFLERSAIPFRQWD